jgi:hypothetical protein
VGFTLIGGNYYYFKKYQYAVTFSSKRLSGQGLTQEDLDKGLSTIDEKIHQICPQFERWDNLYGEKSKVRPKFLSSSCVLNDHESDDSSKNSDGDGTQTECTIPLISRELTPTPQTLSSEEESQTQGFSTGVKRKFNFKSLNIQKKRLGESKYATSTSGPYSISFR